MKYFFKKFTFNKLNLRLTIIKFLPLIMLKSKSQVLFLKEELPKDNIKIEDNSNSDLEMKFIIRGEYENKLRAFASIEKKFAQFGKKDKSGKYHMEYVNFFESLTPFPYAKVQTHKDVIIFLI